MTGLDCKVGCVVCGGPFPPSVRRKRFYCSDKCNWAAQRRKKGRPERKPARIAANHCLGCGLPFRRDKARGSKDSVSYCSRDCFASTINRVRLEREALRRIGRKARRSAKVEIGLVQSEVNALYRIANFRMGLKTTVRPCAGCGRKCSGKGEHSRTCDPCKRVANAIARKSDGVKASRRKSKLARRAIERGLHAERIDPLDIIRRDGESCYICGTPTPIMLRGSYEPNAPEIDHVIPLALGGLHTYENVKCCCRSCNLGKGASPYPRGELNNVIRC